MNILNSGFLLSTLDGSEIIFNKGIQFPTSYKLEDGIIYNQRDTPYCAPFVIKSIINYQYKIFKDSIISIDEKDLYSKRNRRIANEGMSPKDCFEILKNIGVKTNINNKIVKILKYEKLTNIASIKQAILLNGPVFFALTVRDSNNFTEFWKGENVIGGHAIAAIGWNNSGIILKNSYGLEWGNGGIYTISYEDLMKNLLEAWTCETLLN